MNEELNRKVVVQEGIDYMYSTLSAVIKNAHRTHRIICVHRSAVFDYIITLEDRPTWQAKL